MRRATIIAWLVAVITFALLPLFVAVRADDPTPAPPVITASKEVLGTGKRADPFVFDASTKCILKLNAGTNQPVSWDIEDAPASAEVIGTAVIFALSEPGDYVIVAHGAECYAKAWFTIKGPNGPPGPSNQLAAKLKAVLIGVDAKVDAARLAGMAAAVADALEAGKFKTMGELGAAWKAVQTANQWPGGKYPGLPDAIRLAMPPADESAAIDPSIGPNLRTIEKTARGIANG